VFEQRSKLLGLGCLAHDLVLTVFALPLAYWVRTQMLPHAMPSLPAIYPLRHYLPMLASVILLWLAVGFVLGIYRRVELRSPGQIIADETKLVLAGMVLIIAGLYLFHADVSRSLVATFGVLDAALMVTGRLTLFYAKGSLRRVFGRYHYILIVGTGADALELAELVEGAEPLGLRLVGFVHPSDPGTSPPLGSLRRSYPLMALEEVPTILHNHIVDEVLVAVDKQDMDRLEPLIVHCEREGVRTRIHLNFLQATSSKVTLEHLSHVPLLTLSTIPHDEMQLLAKRFVDVILSALLLLLLWPFMLVIAVLIELSSKGPVLYQQTRCGLGGRRFVVYKFRSMVAGAEQMRPEIEHLNEADGPVFKIADDPRVTKVGKWLRRSSMDELPQLWNILKGDMSFVGPRPPVPEEVEKYESWQRRRLRMRPGMTCLWALEGRSQLSFDRWMQLDLSYIDRWSLWLDAKIFLQTIPHVLFGRGAW
jgi:exopolysaccharide biosynthesis polyprenyl glycosylphosphotransferase